MTSRGKCLVIEDDEDIAGLLEVILTTAGFDVRVEASGTEGLLAATSVELTLITLDLGLPDMDGREVAGLLRAVTNAPILMITAFA
ncbi:response regulator, partial [Paenarthrobacter sp. CM16]|uniref:response regulator n=1 Tax=Paenarthrobacter sp. CM16 TaxID=2738447 RepID=UPI001553CDB3